MPYQRSYERQKLDLKALFCKMHTNNSYFKRDTDRILKRKVSSVWYRSTIFQGNLREWLGTNWVNWYDLIVNVPIPDNTQVQISSILFVFAICGGPAAALIMIRPQGTDRKECERIEPSKLHNSESWFRHLLTSSLHFSFLCVSTRAERFGKII